MAVASLSSCRSLEQQFDGIVLVPAEGTPDGTPCTAEVDAADLKAFRDKAFLDALALRPSHTLFHPDARI